jgi:hypothetical protein
MVEIQNMHTNERALVSPLMAVRLAASRDWNRVSRRPIKEANTPFTTDPDHAKASDRIRSK